MVEGEKSIRLKSLVQFSSFEPTDIREVFQTSTADRMQCIEDAALLVAESVENLPTSDVLDQDAMSITFYVAGYIARSLSKSLKCEPCVNLLVEKKEPPEQIIINLEDATTTANLKVHSRFLDMVNRGGLFIPTDFVFSATSELYILHKRVFSDNETKSLLLKSPNPRDVFVGASSKNIKNDDVQRYDVSCEHGHSFLQHHFPRMASKMFNMCTGNYVREINSTLHELKKRSSCPPQTNSGARKITKLQSK